MSPKSNVAAFYSIIIFFKIFGLVPLKITVCPKTKKLTANYKLRDAAYNLVLILCIIFSLCFRHLKSSNSKFEIVTINDFAEKAHVMMETIAAAIILFSYARNQRSAVKIFQHLVELDSDLSSTNRTTGKFFATSNFTSKNTMVSIILAHTLLGISSFVFETIYNAHSPWFNITRGLPMFLIAAHVIQYSLIIIHLKSLFSSMNSSLLAIKKTNPELGNRKLVSERPLDALKKLRKIYRKLREISKVISEFHSWPILFVFLHVCLALTFNCWKLYNHINNDKLSGKLVVKYLKCIMTVVWILRILHPISTLIISITKLFFEVAKTDKIVDEIKKTFADNVRIKEQTEQFSMELLHKNMNFNAFGLFSLDGPLLISLLHTAIIYTFIIINYNNRKE